jgi:hypothetical protein
VKFSLDDLADFSYSENRIGYRVHCEGATRPKERDVLRGWLELFVFLKEFVMSKKIEKLLLASVCCLSALGGEGECMMKYTNTSSSPKSTRTPPTMTSTSITTPSASPLTGHVSEEVTLSTPRSRMESYFREMISIDEDNEDVVFEALFRLFSKGAEKREVINLAATQDITNGQAYLYFLLETAGVDKEVKKRLFESFKQH